MATERTPHLVNTMCRGQGQLFREQACEHFVRSTGACNLLRDGSLDRICECGRCVLSVIQYAQESLARRFSKEGNPLEDFRLLDDREDIDLEALLRRLKRVNWERGDSPIQWFKYLIRTVNCAVLEIASKRGLLPRRKRCGTCLHLPESPPLICQKSGQPRKMTNSICQEPPYAPKRLFFESTSRYSDNPGVAEQDNFDLRSVPEALCEMPTDQQQAVERIDIEILMARLRKRALAEKAGSKRRDVLTRQHDLLSNLYSRLRAGCSEKEAVDLIADETGIHPKTVSRDFDEIRKFFETEMS